MGNFSKSSYSFEIFAQLREISVYKLAPFDDVVNIEQLMLLKNPSEGRIVTN